MKLLYIEWLDAVANPAWFTESMAEDWHDTTQYTVKECGWLIKEDERGITIASRLKPDDMNTELQVGGLQFIPKPWIIKRQEIKIK